MAVCLLILMYFSAAPLIRLLITSDSIYGATYEFFTWRIWGFLFAFVNVMFRGLYIGITRTKVLTMNAVVMALVNVVLDYALVFGELGLPEMGVRGAALASVIAEASSLLFFLLYTYYKVDLKKYGLNRFGQFDLSMVLRILRISCFTMVQYFLAMAIWFVFFMALERLGQRQLAVANIVRSVYVVLLIPVQALSTTANTLVSNLIGAGGSSGVVTLLHKISRMSFLIMVVCVGLCVAFPGSILSVYTRSLAGGVCFGFVCGVRGYADCFAGQCVLQWHIRNGQYAGGVGIGSVCTSFLCTLYHCGGHGYPGIGRRMLHHGSDLLRIDVRFQSHLSEKSKMAEQKDLSILIFL